MVHTRAQRRVVAAAEHNMTGGSATLPDGLLLRALELVMLWDGQKEWRGAVRGVSRRWRALHDSACTWLRLHNGVTDEGMHALCGRLPALKTLILATVTSLTADGLRAVGGLPALTYLDLERCNVTDAVLRELRSLTALTTLYLGGCTHVTDVGLQHINSLTALTTLYISGTSTTQAGRNALKAALPALTINYW